MEAVSFEHYLLHKRVITLAEAGEKLPSGIMLTGEDYVLGLYDLVGELMRFAITTMAVTGEVPRAKDAGDGSGDGEGGDILTDMRTLRAAFGELDTSKADWTLTRDVGKKMEVMKTCVDKVEAAVYGMIIRGRERPKGWVPDAMPDERMAVETR